MGKSNTRRLRAHWAKAIPDRPLALQLIKVRPFIYTACRLRQVTSDLVEQAEEPLAILTVTQPANSPRTVHVYDGVFRINSVFSTFCRPPDFKCSCRIRFRGQCFWLVRLLDYEIDCNSDEAEFNLVINLLSVVKEFHLKDAVFLNVPNVMCALGKSEGDLVDLVRTPQPPPVSAPALSPPSLPCIPGVFAVSQASGSIANKSIVPVSSSDGERMEEPQFSQQLTQLPLTKEAVLDGPSDPVDISLLSTLSEWADFVPAAMESSGSKHKENVETHQLDAVCEMVDLTQPNLAQSGLPERMNISDVKDAPNNPVCVVASTPKKESFTSQQPHELSSTPSIADRTRSFLRFPIDLIRNLVNRFAIRYEPLANPTPLDHPVELLEGPNALKRRKQTEDSSSTAGVVLRSLCYRLRKSYASSMLQKNRTGLRTTKHPGTGTSRPSLCAALIDSFMHDQVPFDDTTVDSIRDVCPETPELQSAPARITVKRKVNHSEMNGINVLTKVVKEIAALNAITLSPSNEERFRAIEETV